MQIITLTVSDKIFDVSCQWAINMGLLTFSLCLPLTPRDD